MRRFATNSWVALVILMGAGAIHANATHYYVNVFVSDDGSNPGTSWNTAFGGPNALQRALTVARTNQEQYDIIWVAGTTNPIYPAIYRPGSNRTDSFDIPIDVKVYGGFAGNETLEQFDLRNEFTHPTYLDGDINETPSDPSDNSYHVVTIGDADRTTTKFSGFTIQNGNANAESGSNAYGGGIFIAAPNGGVSPSLDRLFIRNNKARSAGAGLYSATSIVYLTNTRFEFNEATDATGEGGGLSIQGSGTAILQNCVFFSNTSGGIGGGAAVTSSTKPRFSNCTFSANTAVGRLIAGDVRYGHAVYSSATNCYIQNSIVWANASATQPQLDGPGTPSGFFAVSYSDVQTGAWAGAGNIAEDPLFRDPASGVVTVSTCSPCIDTGFGWIVRPRTWYMEPDYTDLDENGVREGNPSSDDPEVVATPWDYKDRERFVRYRETGDLTDVLDMGATEECPGDFDGDGDVDITDLTNLLSVFGEEGCSAGGCARADFDCNGSISISDLAVLLSRFGFVCNPGVHNLEGDPAGAVATSVTAYDTFGYTGSGFYGEKYHFVFDVFCTVAESDDDWIGSGVILTAANDASFRLVPNAGNPPTPGDSVPEKYATFFSEPRAVNYSGRFTNPMANGAIAGKYNGGAGAFTYTSTAINAAWYDTNTVSNDGPAAVFRIVINVSGVIGADTSAGFGSVYFTTGSPGTGDIQVADMTFDVEHKYGDSATTITIGSFYVTD